MSSIPPTLPRLRHLPTPIEESAYRNILAMHVTLILILSTFFTQLIASPTELRFNIKCMHMPHTPTVHMVDCTHLLDLLSRNPRTSIFQTYSAGDRVDFGLGSCYFRIRAKDSKPGVRELIRLIEYFPALQQISNECLETPAGFDGGKTPVGQYFWAALGAYGLVGGVRNRTDE